MQNISLADERIYNFITPVSYFVNHVKQLQLLKDNIEKYNHTSIVGVSGMGKTQLARMYVYENKHNYKLIWFFDCNLDLNNEFLKLAKIINKTFGANISENPVSVKKEIMDYLAHQDKWLLVFDNLKINNNKKVQDLINWEHNGHVIFCSQDSEMLPNTISMSEFNNNDAITLANNILGNKDNGSAEFIAQSFKGYPVLIVQGAQLLNQVKGLDREEYKKKVQLAADKIKLNITLALKELKPDTVSLLNKIALLNNQSFSKQVLKAVTDNQATISDDIYNLSKFMLISNVDPDENNPVFEMHDVIAQKIMELNQESNKKILEHIIDNLIKIIPKSAIKGRIFRNAKTIPENLAIISRNAEKYDISTYKAMELNLQLIIQYTNSVDFYRVEQKVKWLDENYNKGRFKLWLMSNDEKARYAAYLGLIGNYHNIQHDYNKAIEYFTRAKTVFESVKGYEAYKLNAIYTLAVSNVGLGQISEAKNNVNLLETIINSHLVDEGDIGFLPLAKTRLLFMKGEYPEALKQINTAIQMFINSGLSSNDLFFTSLYLLRAKLLNISGNYKEAYDQADQLYNMHSSVKRENNEILGYIYTQMAKSELGQNNTDKALSYISKAMSILLPDKKKLQNINYKSDSELAASYIVQGDIFFMQNDLKRAIQAYRAAQKIYFYLYKDNSRNVERVSYLYTQGAKAACKAKDLYHYKCFGKPQVKEFGREHKNTIDMFEYCKQYDTNLWQDEH